MRFPLNFIPKESWTTPPRSFGAARSGTTRLHGACDLYGPAGTPVYAIEDGTVQLGPYPFVQYRADKAWVHAIEVVGASGLFRYCELHFVPEIKQGRAVKEGDLLGHMGDMGIGATMCHLEYFRNDVKGPLTVKGANAGKYGRRADLVDPTTLLNELAARVAAVAS